MNNEHKCWYGGCTNYKGEKSPVNTSHWRLQTHNKLSFFEALKYGKFGFGYYRCVWNCWQCWKERITIQKL